MAKKSKKTKQKVVTEAPVEDKNPAISRFERVFYRFFAWFPILVLPTMVWDMMTASNYAMGGIIGFIHAVLVFRFMTVVNVAGWFQRSDEELKTGS